MEQTWQKQTNAQGADEWSHIPGAYFRRGGGGGEGSARIGFCSTYRAHEAGVVPGEPQSLQELVPSLDGEVAAVAVGSKQVVVVCVGRQFSLCFWTTGDRDPDPPPICTFFTVRLPVLHVEHAVSDGLLTGDADEAGHVPGLF